MATRISLDPDMLDVLMPMHLLVSREGIVTHAGPTLAKVLPGRRLVGTPALDLLELRRPAQLPNIRAMLQRAGVRLSLRFRDAERTPVTGAAIPLADGEGVLVNLSFGIAVVDAVKRYGLAGSDFAATDLTLELLYLVEANAAAMEEARKAGERLAGERSAAEAEAMSDTLTGLRNRRALDQGLDRLVARRIPFALMHIDLDFFKAVNDTLGHAAGDQVLTSVARILREETRGADVVARVGGDEFVIAFSGLIDETRLANIAARLIHRLEEPVPYGDQTARISASIGITISTHYAWPDAVRMHRDADRALYASKRRGRASYTLHHPAAGDAPAAG